MDLFLFALAVSSCLALPALLIGLPFVWWGVRSISARPERRTPIAAALALGSALANAPSLGAFGFLLGMAAESEDAGAVMAFLGVLGLVGGAVFGFFGTLALVLWATRPRPAPSPGEPPALEASARSRAVVGASVGLLLVGVATSLGGLLLSLSLGVISLAFAGVAVRPIASAFALAHLLAGLLTALGLRDVPSRRVYGAAVLIQLTGVALAALIAAFGPDFFDAAIRGAARGMLV